MSQSVKREVFNAAEVGETKRSRIHRAVVKGPAQAIGTARWRGIEQTENPLAAQLCRTQTGSNNTEV